MEEGERLAGQRDHGRHEQRRDDRRQDGPERAARAVAPGQQAGDKDNRNDRQADGTAAIGAEQAAEIRGRIDEAHYGLAGQGRSHEIGTCQALQRDDVHAWRDDEIGQ